MAKQESDVRQQIIDKISEVETVLVAVNSNPSVDELSAAMGLTLALNKLGKHATAVFSGEVPMAIEFLEPDKTFENSVDSLRDFIIALDKEKADHLRYKVEGDMVKIFITPYRTNIDEKDLEFSQGDYNVEMVLAVGVKDESDLDRALSDHGRILHDAIVAGIGIGSNNAALGSITWHNEGASSYSELVSDLVVKLKSDNEPNLLDEQISTALLTGIVAATNRFSNDRTTSRAMTLSAQLMAAGANQQLIATKLEEANELSGPSNIKVGKEAKSGDADTAKSKDVARLDVKKDDKKHSGEKDKKTKTDDQKAKDKDSDQNDQGDEAIDLKIENEKPEEEPETRQDIEHEGSMNIEKDETNEATSDTALAEEMLEQGLANTAPAPAGPTDIQSDLEQATASLSTDNTNVDQNLQSNQEVSDDGFIETPLAGAATSEPSFGGTLNATSEQAAIDKRLQEQADRNKTILSHGGQPYIEDESNSQQSSSPNVPSQIPSPQPEFVGAIPGRAPDIQPPSSAAPSAPIGAAAPMTSPNLNPAPVAQMGVPTAPGSLPALPTAPNVGNQSAGGLPPLPPMPNFPALPPIPPPPATAAPQQPAPPAAPPAPTQPHQLPTVSPMNQSPLPNPVAQETNDPAAFQIPGQS